MKGSTGRIWNLLPPAPLGTLDDAGLPPVVAQVLYHRDVTNSTELDAFLKPSHRLPYEPFLLPGVEQASHRLAQALNKGESISIFGDFDVDGVTGTALLAQGLQALGKLYRTYPTGWRRDTGSALGPFRP